MNLKVGIVGLPNAGKSTLFNALIGRQLSKVAEYPFTTIEPHEGVVDVPDERLARLSAIVKPEKTTPATVTFIDIAGLVRGAHRGEGLGNEFLGHIREVSAILHVVRAFESPQAQHPLGTVDPPRDIEIVNTELLLKDLSTVNKKLEAEHDSSRKAFWMRVVDTLDKGGMGSDIGASPEEKEWLGELGLLTAKPMVCVLNISEAGLTIRGARDLEEKNFLVLSGKLEAELTELPPAERKEYLRSVGVDESSLVKVVQTAYQILDLVTFYTIKGGREVRAWALPRGSTALTAAGKVHTDFAKRFIRAEVIGAPELFALGSWQTAREQGKVRLEGREYVVKDGDVIEFKTGA